MGTDPTTILRSGGHENQQFIEKKMFGKHALLPHDCMLEHSNIDEFFFDSCFSAAPPNGSKGAPPPIHLVFLYAYSLPRAIVRKANGRRSVKCMAAVVQFFLLSRDRPRENSVSGAVCVRILSLAGHGNLIQGSTDVRRRRLRQSERPRGMR